MDDSTTNNLFNDPVTGADKNDDFLTEASSASLNLDVKDSEMKGLGAEKPVAGETESPRSHRDKLKQKAKALMGRSKGDGESAHEGRKLGQAQRELDAKISKDEAEKDLIATIKDARVVNQLASFGKKFSELGGYKRFPEVAAVIGGLSLTALTLFLSHKGFDTANYIPDLTKGVIAGFGKQPISEALEHHGIDTEKSRALPWIEKGLGAVAGALSLNNLGEAVSVHDPVEFVLESVSLATSAGVRIVDRFRSKKREETPIANSSEPPKPASPLREPVAAASPQSKE